MAAGTPASDRWLVAEIGFYDLGQVILADPASVVIGGVTAALKSSTNGAADSGNFRPAIYSYWAFVPLGTTASVVVNLSANASSDFIGVSLYAVTGADITNPVVATAKTSLNSTTSVTSGVIPIPAGGALIAMGSSLNSAGPLPSWTNATLDAAFNAGNGSFSSASGTTPGSVAVTYADANGVTFNMQINCVAIQAPPPVDLTLFGVLGAATSEW